MYRPVNSAGDTIGVPQLVFSRLSASGGTEACFRVALFILAHYPAAAQDIADALHLPMRQVEAALSYWEGAGLIAREAVEETPKPQPQKRQVLTTRQAVAAGRENPELAWLLEELQRLFGTVLGQSDVNLFVTLYAQDGFDADLILLASALAKAESAQRKAAYVQRILFNWREMDITDCTTADRYLRLLSERETNEKALAQAMGLEWDPFSRADKKKIAVWFEEYGYSLDMIEAARLAAGEKRNSVAYLAGILKKWQGKGYRTPRDVQQGDENRNIRVFRQDAPTGGSSDLLADITDFVPMEKRNVQ